MTNGSLEGFEWDGTSEAKLCHKIFVVDDDEDFGKFALKLLKVNGYESEHFRNAFEFLSRLRTEIPDLIILDIRMSWINGFDLARGIRKNPQLKDIPILMITGYPTSEARFQGFKSGADAFLEKPFEAMELIQLVQALIENKKEQAPKDS